MNAIAAATATNETAVNHVHIGNDTSSDSDDDNSNLGFCSLMANQCVVHNWDGSDQVFVESNRGLYFVDLIETGFLLNKKAGSVNNDYKHSSHKYSNATLARKIQRIVDRPSTKVLIHLVENNNLKNCL